MDMSAKDKVVLGATAFVLGAAVVGTSMPVRAGDAGAFIGGVFATKLLDNMSRRTDAEEAQAAAAAQPRYVEAAPRQKSPEERMKELDKLAAGGYITPEEYKAKKKQILDGM
jgi:high-affinity K+ transport system ATPase subunit B